jgi:hypothetical protein
VVPAPGVTLAGTHESVDTLGLGATVIVAVVLPPSDADTTTVCGVPTDPAVAVNEADVAVAATVTDVGTGNAVALSDDSATALPPAGAG